MNLAHKISCSIIATTMMLSISIIYASPTTESILTEYKTASINSFSISNGEKLWTKNHNGRSCTSCHSLSAKTQGKHQRTNKIIKPMSPSINPKRLTNRKKIDKWLLRNCKWTFGRECTTQEKGDILLWLSTQ